MTLTIGSGPFGDQPGGAFNFPMRPPEAVLYFEESPRRVRVMFNGQTVADSSHAKLLHESGRTPTYYFPGADVNMALLEPSDHATHSRAKGPARYWTVRVGSRTAPDAARSYTDPPDGAEPLGGYLAFSWNEMDAWWEEDEQVFVHARDPYTRIDVRDSSRQVRVLIGGMVIADTKRPKVLFESGLPPRYYMPQGDVRMDLLVPSDATSGCAYKGFASYWSVQAGDTFAEDVVWTYRDPFQDASRVKDLLCFLNERVDLEVDGAVSPRPRTKFS